MNKIDMESNPTGRAIWQDEGPPDQDRNEPPSETAMNSFLDWLGQVKAKNLVALALLILLGVAEYANYQTEKKLERVCELLGPHDVYVSKPATARQTIDDICIGQEPTDDGT